MNFSVPNPQLQLSLVQFRATVEILRTQDFRIPLASPLPVADLNIDVLDHRNPGHDLPPFDLMCSYVHAKF